MNKRYTSALLSKGDSPSALPLSEEIIGEEIANGDISSSLFEETLVASDVNEIVPCVSELLPSEEFIVAKETKANAIEGFICALLCIYCSELRQIE